MSPRHDELKTLRVLLTLPRDILDGFAPQQPPEPVAEYIQDAPRRQLQWMLIDILHRLRTDRPDPGADDRHQHDESTNGEQRPCSD